MLVLSSLLRGYALSILWGWFVVPVFGLPRLSVLQAIGIAMVVGFLTHQTDEYKDNDKSTKERMIEAVILAILTPLFALFFGYIVHSFM